MGGMGMGGGAFVNFASLQTRMFQSVMLSNLIRVVITDADWDLASNMAAMGGGGGGLGGGGMGGLGGGGLGGGGMGGLGGGGMGGGNAQPVKGDPTKDQMFYYDAAIAQVFRAPSKRTTRLPSPYKRKGDEGAPAGAAPGGPPGGGLGLNRGNDNGSALANNSNKNNNNSGANKADNGTMVASKDKDIQDPTTFWNDAISKNGTDNSLTLAAVDFLTQHGKSDHAAALLKAALRNSVSPRPWMYEALALSLEMSNGSPEEIEQALLSVADLKPGKSDGLLTAAKAMAKHSKWQKAVEFCKKSSELNPQNPQPYLDALGYAQSAKDTAAMAWAAGNLLAHDWPVTEVDIHGQARQAAEKLATALSQDGRGAEASKLLQGFDAQTRRDLVVKLTYQGEAELELEATDPTGSSCSTLARQSVGGGSLITETAGRAKKFSVAEAFPGQYTFTVRRVWGRPTGNKATLEIIENQGTADERIERTTVTLDDESTLSFDLKAGRRQAPAVLASPETFRTLVNEQRINKAAGNSTQLDHLASPVVMGGEGKVRAVQGAKAITARNAEMEKLALLGQTDVDLPTQGGVGLATSTRATANGKNLSIKVTPIFVKQNVAGSKLPVIPGSGS